MLPVVVMLVVKPLRAELRVDNGLIVEIYSVLQKYNHNLYIV